jgi:DNA-binding IclR family transcriptional regulator
VDDSVTQSNRTAPGDATKTSQVKSAGRALDIIEVLSSSPNGMGFVELARLQRIPRSSLHALLSVLTERGFVDLDSHSRTYTLGIRAWEVGQGYVTQRDLVGNARPVMERVVEAINETVQLAVLDGIENVYLAKVDCSHPVRLQSEVGKRLYAHATGLGKALLAGLAEAELHVRFSGLALPKMNHHTIHEFPDLVQRLEIVRAIGFAVDDQEYTEGLRCVAVPIVDRDGQTVAALSASIPLTRAGPEQMAAALREIAAASIDISRRLGSTTPDQRLATLAQWRGDVLHVHSDDSVRRFVPSGPAFNS